MEIDYYYRHSIFNKDYFYNRNDIVINNIIRKIGLKPKKYITRNDQKLLIPLKNELVKILENELLKFPIKKFSKKILSLISEKIYYKNQFNFIRNNFTKKSSLFYDVHDIELQIKILKYILEKRMELGSKAMITNYNIKPNLEYIIKISELSYNLNLCLDFMYYQLELGYIEIDNNYNLKIKFKKLNYNSKYLENSYDANNKIITADIMKEYINSFKLDMGFDINDFTEVSSCLCVDIPSKKFYKVKNNVLEIKKEKLVKLIEKYNQSHLSVDSINKILSYLIIDNKHISATYNRESQLNRIDQKPIICDEDILYYSPALVSEIHKFFTYAILIYDFPYKKDLPNISKTLEKVKKLSEKQIVYDIADIIKKNITGLVYVEKKLHQINSNIDKNYSESIGDYDILAIDTNKKIIYNIEVKNLKLFSTIYEMYRQYYGFYHKNNYEFKFSRRIDALKKYYKSVFPSCFITDIDSYKMVNIFLTNKYFIPLFTERKDILYLCYPMLDDYFNFQSKINDIVTHWLSAGGEGAEVIYALRNNNVLANLVLDELGKTGQLVRETYQRRLPSNPSKDYYFIHRETGKTQPIIVEYGFLDTPSDATRLKNNYKKYAEAVVKAIVEYLNLTYDKNENQTIYTVKSGDSLWSIAKKYNISVEELKLANNLTNNLLNIGQKLIIPSKQTQTTTDDYDIYIVKSGDSLYSIAQRYGVSVNDLIEANNLSTTNLKIGDQLLIPKQKESNYITYKVKQGDSLYQIAQKYGITVNEIKNTNNLTSNLLQIGETLLIPTKKAESTPLEPSTTDQTIYTVKSGDNLYDIARIYNVTVGELKKANNLNTNNLTIGQKLIIPTSQSTIIYTVKSGDNLYSIARKYNKTVSDIKRQNNLTSNTLAIGQKLII